MRYEKTIKGTTYYIEPDKAWWTKHWKKVAGAIAVGVVALMLFGCNAGVSGGTPEPTQFSCSITGTVDAPPQADRELALAIEAQSKGIALTGDYKADAAKQGGEMILIGSSFKFVFDEAGKVIEPQSHLNLFLKDYPVDGGMQPDGNLGMAVDVGGAKVGIKGQVLNGKFINGEVRKGWLPHIYGVLNGTTDCK